MRQRERMQRSRRHSLLRRLAHGVPRRFVFGAFALISHSASPTPKPTLMEHAMGNVPFRPVATGSTTHVLGNTLVLIASKDSKLGNVTIKPGLNLAQLAGNGLIAIGDVQAVPVGIYAKEALEKLGSWDAAAAKFTMTQDVRAALALVAQGVASL